MRRFFWGVLISVVLLAGCSTASKQPKAVAPEQKVDFGNVPVVTDMSQAKVKEFEIRNEGTADLRIKDVQVKLLQGC